jgi:(4-(4-[2-(gamma-L-glutamylamino)ethyl]phenoxymethyl)furan-2-yl)methanamine synthase
MSCLGLDIGGANLKAANTDGWAKSIPFALWQNPSGLENALQDLIAAAPPADQLAITMTGELCDCFPTKVEGVRHILNAVDGVADGRNVLVYLTDGRYVSIAEARELPQLAAASNWRALAEFVCRQFTNGQSALLIDIGSTTTDIIPIVAGRVAAIGRTDTERLINSELVYTGVGRTPVCAVVKSLPYRGKFCPVAAEVFSTTADAYLVIGKLAEDPEVTIMADGRPMVLACAQQRLARQICSDSSDLTETELHRFAEYVCDFQREEIGRAATVVLQRTINEPTICIVSGSGEFLAGEIAARILPEGAVLSLSHQLGWGVSCCAPAFAVADGSHHSFR